jgi:hypothetical protein
MQNADSDFSAVEYLPTAAIPALPQPLTQPLAQLPVQSPGNLSLARFSKVQWRPSNKRTLICEEFSSRTPVSQLMDLLREFVINTSAEIKQVEADFAELSIEYKDQRKTLLSGNFNLQIEFQPVQESGQGVGRNSKWTAVRIVISEGKKKWFRKNELGFAPTVLRELRRCLTIGDESCRRSIGPA